MAFLTRILQPHKTTSVDEKPVTPENLQGALTLFYGIMGWNPDSGVPTETKLTELDPEWLIDSVQAFW